MKITTETVARLARLARAATNGAYGVTEAARPGKPPKVDDAGAGLIWEGPDANRQAAAFYAGVIDQAAQRVPGWVKGVLAETGDRHRNHAEDGRAAARHVSAGAR